MRAIKAQITKYKSISDSGAFAVDERITALVGKNEAGKTGALEAIYRFMPLPGGHPNIVRAAPGLPSQQLRPRQGEVRHGSRRSRRRSRCGPSAAHSSPRPMPVTRASQTSIAQSSSRHASSAMRAAWRGAGGWGSGCGAAGGATRSIGLVPSHFQRTARAQAPLRMWWICRIDASASGLHSLGPAPAIALMLAGSAVLDQLLAAAVPSAGAQMRVERVEDLGLAVEPAERKFAHKHCRHRVSGHFQSGGADGPGPAAGRPMPRRR